MAELQEVQITEEKPLLPGQTPETAKVNGDLLTPCFCPTLWKIPRKPPASPGPRRSG